MLFLGFGAYEAISLSLSLSFWFWLADRLGARWYYSSVTQSHSRLRASGGIYVGGRWYFDLPESEISTKSFIYLFIFNINF